MKAKHITALLTALTVTVALSACGNKNDSKSSVSAKEKTESKAKASVTEMVNPAVDCMSRISDMTSVLSDEVTEAAVEAATEDAVAEEVSVHNVQAEASVAADSSDSNSSATNKTKTDNSGSSSSATNKTKTGDSDSGSSAANKTKTNDSGSVGSVSDYTSTSTHEHTWKEHTSQRWVSQIVTVTDEPGKSEEYTYYKLYWYNTDTWEETYDASRYDELGCPTFLSDHVIVTGYHYIPAVTHEEDQGHYETYVDYYYCDCGAKK